MDEQLTALDLMMDLADEIHINTVGAPKPRRRRKGQKDQFSGDTVVDAMDFLKESERGDFQYAGTVEVGGSRPKKQSKASRTKTTPAGQVTIAQAKAKEASATGMATIIAPTIVSPTLDVAPLQGEIMPREIVPVRPPQAEIDEALRQLFENQNQNTNRVLDGIGQHALITKRVADTLDKWLTWEQDRAYREDHRVKDDDHRRKVSEQFDAGQRDEPGDQDDGFGGMLPDRNKGNKKPDNKKPPKAKPKRKFGRGKWGAIIGGGLALFGLSAYASANASDELAASQPGANLNMVPEGAQPAPRPMNTEVPEGKYDNIADAAEIGAYGVGALKRIPGLGAAASLAKGGYDMSKIAAATDMTDEEKKRAYTKTAVSAGSSAAGATAGGVIGGFIGSIIPVAGTAAGAALGSVIGGYLGDFFGDSIGEYVSGVIHDDTEEAAAKRKEKLRELSPSGLGGLSADAFSPINPHTGQSTNPLLGLFDQGTLNALMAAGAAGGALKAGGFTSNPGGVQQAVPYVAGKSLAHIAENIDQLPMGAVTAHFESGNLGVGAVSTGAGDLGGVSYGRHQIASQTGSMAAFIASPENQAYAAQFAGLKPGSAEFNNVYKQVAGQDPTGFANAQAAWIERTHFKKLRDDSSKALGHDFSKRGRAVQEYMFTFANQYGAYTDAVKSALGGKDLDNMSDADVINAMVDWRAATIPQRFKSSSQAVRDSVLKRTGNERATLLDIVAREEGKTQRAEPSTQITETGAAASIQQVETAAIKPVQKPQPVVEPLQPVATTLVEPKTAEQPEIPKSLQAAQAAAAAVPIAQMSAAPPENTKHSLDSIPVYVDDPMLNMINLGYI